MNYSFSISRKFCLIKFREISAYTEFHPVFNYKILTFLPNVVSHLFVILVKLSFLLNQIWYCIIPNPHVSTLLVKSARIIMLMKGLWNHIPVMMEMLVVSLFTFFFWITHLTRNIVGCIQEIHIVPENQKSLDQKNWSTEKWINFTEFYVFF